MDAYTGEIRMFAGNYAPYHWAFCSGQVLSIEQNQILYSLLGTIYGGDGKTTFALPDFRGRIPVHAGQGQGLTAYKEGLMFGKENVLLTVDQIPAHNHPLQASTEDGTLSSPSAVAVLSKPEGEQGYEAQGFAVDPDPDKIVELADEAVYHAGGNSSHTNMMPALCISFIICIAGIYPPRN